MAEPTERKTRVGNLDYKKRRSSLESLGAVNKTKKFVREPRRTSHEEMTDSGIRYRGTKIGHDVHRER